MPRRPSPLAAALAALLAVAGCRSQNTTSQTPAKPPAPGTSQAGFSSPRDDLGREVKLQAPARRVAVIGPGVVETIFALGAGERIIGRDSAADFPAEATKLAILGDFRGPNIEACVKARPDLVLVQGETYGRERMDGWQSKIGVPVAALAATTVDGVQKDADKMAAWLGVKPLDLGLDSTTGKLASARPRAFIEISRSPLWTSGQGSLVSDVVERGGFENVARDVVGYKEFSKEALLQRQPDFYITTGKAGSKPRILAELRADAALGSLKCVQRGKVLVIPGDFLLRPGPRLKDGLQALREASSKPG